MPADLLIFKKRGQKTRVKITKGMRNGHTPEKCDIVVNLKNYRDLALFFQDLKWLWGAPVDKAIVQYNQDQHNLWPFK